MKIHRAPGKKCKFLFPLLPDVDLSIDYKGRVWSAGLSNLDSLDSFSVACAGFRLGQINKNGMTFLFIQKKDFVLHDRIDIFFESSLQEDFPCAFFDETQKKMDDFEIPADAQGIALRIDNGGYFIASSLAYVEEEEEEAVADTPISRPLYTSPSGSDSSPARPETKQKYLDFELEKAQAENQALRARISALEAERDALQEQLNASGGASGGQEEAERLKTLIAQLVDKEYSADFLQAKDTEINQLTQKIGDQRAAAKKKADSLKLLQDDLKKVEGETKDLADQITQTMDLLQKAETMKNETAAEQDSLQARLNSLLDELNIDLATLQMYETKDGAEALLAEGDALKQRMEAKLKDLIAARQTEVADRFQQVTS